MAKNILLRNLGDVHISVATANFYFMPFEQTLEIIAGAGFEYIELDLYWQRGTWAMAQHLKDWPVREVIQAVSRSGLKVSSIHDGGGVMEDPHSIRGFINPQLDAYLDRLGYAPGCIVFHTPHIKGNYGERWWQTISDDVLAAAERYKSDETVVTIENMPFFDGYTVPLTDPAALMAFVAETELGVTLDTTHYAQIGIDIVQAACILGKKIRTIHLGDYVDGQTHVFIGEGDLDFTSLFRVLDFSVLRSITLECSVAMPGEDVLEMEQARMIDRLRDAMHRLHRWLNAVQVSLEAARSANIPRPWSRCWGHCSGQP
ncbi:MAG: TIM barrel protein [Anaerolineae bacterium]|nr:TIM barrel protein [Anaerolineae bacterium]